MAQPSPSPTGPGVQATGTTPGSATVTPIGTVNAAAPLGSPPGGNPTKNPGTGTPPDTPPSPTSCPQWIKDPQAVFGMVTIREKLRQPKLAELEKRLAVARQNYQAKPGKDAAAVLNGEEHQLKTLNREIQCDALNLQTVGKTPGGGGKASPGSAPQDVNAYLERQNRMHETIYNIIQKNDETRQQMISKLR